MNRLREHFDTASNILCLEGIKYLLYWAQKASIVSQDISKMPREIWVKMHSRLHYLAGDANLRIKLAVEIIGSTLYMDILGVCMALSPTTDANHQPWSL